MPILENKNNWKSSEFDLMWQKETIGEDIITTQVCRNFFIANEKRSQFGQKQARHVLDKWFSFQKPKNSLQLAYHTFIRVLVYATIP